MNNPSPVPSMTEKEKKEQADALKVLSNKGTKEFIKYVFTDKETSKPLTYAEMRGRYG